ncbi:signal recognition particle, SRP14 subunit [Aspergillus pseudonomiae]|uniref:Signal recognition particle subunit SRP14 n=1 Tax=Aspergillus pseudonomiae TaxID=1506151 RepID=A0A5N7CV24_9EURO|nr:signal recognition particle, SRP14 subunit [Aspergillus pseudonomiae]KAB8261208.1 signal recognition particle, SRP14 subunit [Aspergillus pseudonomiae]KAE8398056.1 signal recognition particle, SRP14 subunit [Aspergillus pseudonomiae]
MAPHLGHEEFFSSLADLLSKTSQKARGSVFLTQKPLIDTTASSENASSSRPSILIRATDGNTNAPNPKNNKVEKKKTVSKVKLSTIVAPEDLEAFYTRYAEVCKAGMTGLKKRDRKKGKAKAKGGAKAAKA